MKRILRLLLFCLLCGNMAHAQLSGVKNIPGAYATLELAIQDLNSQGVGTGGVTFNVLSGNPQTAPAGGYQITASGLASDPIIITGNSNTVTASSAHTAGSVFDAVFKIVGGDNITIENFSIQENASNSVSTLASNTMTEFGIALFYASTTDGAQNNTIQNNTISLSGTYQNAIGIFSTTASSSTATTAALATANSGLNSGLKIYGNTISNVAFGISIITPPNNATLTESGIDIGGSAPATGNTITYGYNTTANGGWNLFSTVSAGIACRNAVGANIRYNTVSTIPTLTVASTGIFLSASTTPSGVTYTNTISNNTVTMTNTGTTAITAIDFGYSLSTGTIVGSENIIVINQNATAAVSAAVTGIKANYTSATKTINQNTITINQSETTGALSSTTIAITMAGTGTTLSANNNTVLFNQTTSSSSAVTTPLTGIAATSAASNTLNLLDNTITIKQAVTGSGNYGSGAIAYLSINATHNNVNITGNTFNTTSSSIRSTGAMDAILDGSSTKSGLLTIKNNTANIERISISGNMGFYTQTSTSPNDPADSISNNNISFTNLATSGTVTVINRIGGATTAVKNVCNNTIVVSGTNTGAVVGIANSYAGALTVGGNSITINCASASTSGITFTNGAANGSVTMNTLSLNSSSTAATSMIGISTLTSTGPHNIFNNTFSGLNLTAVFTTTPTVSGIVINSGNGNNVYNNVVTNISAGASGVSSSATVDGILISAGTATNVYKNKIYGLTTSAAGTATVVNGVRISGGTTNSIFNNLIGDLTAPSASSVDAIRGISITSTAASATNNIVFNTVYLNASSTGTNFGTSGIFHTGNATATTAKLVMGNNIIINNSTPSGTGLTVAYRRGSTNIANYDPASNYNIFYAGTPGVSNLIHYDGTNSYQTLAAYKTAMSTIDQNSFTENTAFTTTTGSSAGFLHVNTANPTVAESGGTPVALIPDDFDGDTRSVTNPDIGADEFVGTTPAPQISVISAAPSNPQCVATARTITANVSTVGTPITSVTLNYDNGTAGSVSMSLTSGTSMNGIWTGTIPAASPANSNVTWNVTATDGTFSDVMNGTAYKDAYLQNVNTVAIANPSAICAGNPSALSVSAIEGVLGTAPIGTNTTSVSTTGNPLRAGYGAGSQVKTQMLILASELNAASISAGAITSLGFTTNSVGGIMSNFTLKMGHTTATALTATYQTVPMTTVFTQASYTHVVGLNTYTFSTPFIWDGVSNIVVEVCQTNATTGTISTQAMSPGFTATTHHGGTTACTDASGSTYSTRPVIVLGGTIGTNYTSSMNWTWSPGAITGANPTVSPTNTTTYTASGMDANGCTLTSNGVTVTTTTLPTAPSATNSNQCGPGIPTASVTSNAGANGNGTFLWYDGVGNLLQGPAIGNTLNTYYNNDFSSSTLTNSSISGNAAIAAGVLTLQAALANQQGGLTVNANGVNSTMFQTDFDLTLTSAGTSMADGFSYSFADDAHATTTSPSAEHGSGSKLRIGFFTYNAASGSDGKGIYLMYNVSATSGYTSSTSGVLAYSTDVSWIPTAAGSQTSHVTVSIDAQGQLTLTVGAIVIFTNIQLPAAFVSADKSAWKHVFSSRSGGTAGGFALDNVIIQANSVVPGYTTFQSPVNTTTTFYVAEMGVNGCESQRTPVTVTVNIPDAVTASTSTLLACENAPLNLTATQTGTSNNYVYSWTASPSAGSGITGGPVTGSSVIVTPTLPGTYIYTAAAYDAALLCNTTATVTITVKPQPTNLTAASSASNICAGGVIDLSSTATGTTAVVFDDNFEGATSNWTTTNLTTGGTTPAVAAWAIQSSPYNVSWGEVLSSPGSSKFYLTNSDGAGSGNSTHTILQSPVINATGTTSLSLDFFHYFKYWDNTDSIKVEASTDGINWTLLQDLAQTTPALTQNQSIGAPGNFVQANISLNAYAGNPTLYLRFRFTGIWGYGWAIDSIRITGVFPNTYTWSSQPTGYTANGANQTNVTPTVSTTYIVTATNLLGCTDTAQAFVNVNPLLAGNTINTAQSICSGATPSALTGGTVTGGDGSNYSYAWESSTTSATSGFSAAAGTNNTSGYTPGSLTSDTWYRRVVTSGSCTDTSAAIQITVNPVLSGNTISTSQTICSGNVPAALTGATPTGGSGTYTYLWQSSTTSATSGFAAASGTNNASGYSPSALTSDTWYRRVVTSGGCDDTSAAIQITVQTAIANNTISAMQTICSGSAPAQLTGTTPTGGSGGYTYLWESSTTSGTAGFTAAAGTNNNANYSPTALTANTWYRRVINSGSCSDTSAAIQITVNPVLSGNTISTSQTICSGNVPAALTGATPTGGSGTYTYLWQSSTTSATSGFAAASGTNNAGGYSPSALTSDTWYRRVITSGGCDDTSAAIQITVQTAIANNTISAAQTICSGSAPAQLTGSAPSGGSGTYTYLWESSTTSATTGFTAAAGTNNTANYTPAVLTQTTWFRRTVSGGACASDISAAIAITVNTGASFTTQPAATVDICATNTIVLSVVAANATGYQWYKGTTALTNAGDISGATSANLQITNSTASDAGTYSVVLSAAAGCNNVTSNNSIVTVTSFGSNLATNGSSNTYSHADGFINTYTDASCNPILKIQDASGGNTLGSVLAGVTVSGTVQNAPNGQKYLPRYYTVTPTNNGPAIITLYALQSEFTAYNNAPGSYPQMPTSGNNSDPNISNIMVTKYTGSPFVGGGNAQLLQPTSVTWNTTKNWWEITLNVPSFSSFYIHTGTLGPLDIDLKTISAVNIEHRNRIDWTTGNEVDADKFEIERSADGKDFNYLGVVAAKGAPSTYSFWDQEPYEGINYYRIKMISRSGEFEYSNTVNAILKSKGAFVVDAYPNPVSDELSVKISGQIGANAYLVLTDVTGKSLLQKPVKDVETKIDMHGLAQGVYFIKYIDDQHSKTIKINKH